MTLKLYQYDGYGRVFKYNKFKGAYMFECLMSENEFYEQGLDKATISIND